VGVGVGREEKEKEKEKVKEEEKEENGGRRCEGAKRVVGTSRAYRSSRR
jgi:hypothetical protein